MFFVPTKTPLLDPFTFLLFPVRVAIHMYVNRHNGYKMQLPDTTEELVNSGRLWGAQSGENVGAWTPNCDLMTSLKSRSIAAWEREFPNGFQ